MNTKIGQAAKAVVGFVAPAVVSLGVAVTAGSDGGSSITTSEWFTAVIAALVTSGFVYGVPNASSGNEKNEGA